ncbi:MAG: biotin transporter BioY [Clostridiales bacterium]|nr:biotin transporter BioY [Clostridiales bacterium]MDD7035340.1 biotin transporter BioY [Bacillota bacterium]
MKTKYMALCGLFAALTAVCSWISIPLGFTPVPVNLATLAVFLAGGLLGKKYGSISLIVYTLVGAVGAPVFSGFQGGAGVLAGPTGGYIIGYIAAAFVTGLITEKMSRKKGQKYLFNLLTIALAMVCGLAACYLLGTAWFMISTGTGLGASMVMCVIPFLPGDALKIIAGSLLVSRLRRFI